MDILICAIANNNKPSFVDYQYECFKKYIKGSKFEYILFDNSNNSDEFKRHCDYIGAVYVKVEKSSNKDLFNFIFNNVYNLMKFRGNLLICNLDIFLIGKYDYISKLSDIDILAVSDRPDIFTNNDFLLVNLQKINILYDKINDIRPSILQEYIKKSKELTFKNIDISDSEGLIDCKEYDNCFLKYSEAQCSNDKLFELLCEKLICWNIKPDPKKKYLITFSLFGNNPRYTYNAVMNALLAQKIYQGWICRFYYDDTVPKNIIGALKSMSNVELVENPQNLTLATFWRFFPASEADVAVTIVRDTDSWLSFREAFLVKKWIESDKMFHIIRDHCYHTEHIMAGMFGIKRGKVNNFKELCLEYIKNKHNYYGIDQAFLKNFIYPLVNDSAMIHVTNGYNRDAIIPFEKYPRILEYIPGIDIEQTNDLNALHCNPCGKPHLFFIGVQLCNIHNSTKQLLAKYGL